MQKHTAAHMQSLSLQNHIPYSATLLFPHLESWPVDTVTLGRHKLKYDTEVKNDLQLRAE